ncbi:hypothetical protein ACFL0C_00910, partial [Patescibacteria group bacterium]
MNTQEPVKKDAQKTQARQLNNQALTTLFNTPSGDPVHMINTILHELAYLLASDILLEPQQDGVRVRARIDGVLYEVG